MKTFVVRERVNFFETDAEGMLHFMFALRLFEVGEREAMRQVGVKVGDARRGGRELPRVHVECDYHQRLYYDDEVEVHTTCKAIGNTSLLWEFRVYRENELCISGSVKTVLVARDGRPERVPDEWRNRLMGED
jgi:acyl-CoA thioester hydrolase